MITAIKHEALASEHLHRAPGSSAKRDTGFREGRKTDMGELGVLPKWSNGLEATR